MLTGAEQTIRTSLCPIIYESWNGVGWHAEKSLRVDALLSGLGYEIYQFGQQDKFAVHPDGPTDVSVTYGDDGNVNVKAAAKQAPQVREPRR